MFGQYEDSIDAEHRYVRDGRGVQLPIYIYIRYGRRGRCHRHWTGDAGDGLRDDVFSDCQVEDALAGGTVRIVQAQGGHYSHGCEDRGADGTSTSADGWRVYREYDDCGTIGYDCHGCPFVGHHG